MSINLSLGSTFTAYVIRSAKQDETFFLRNKHVALLDFATTVALYISELSQWYQWVLNLFLRFHTTVKDISRIEGRWVFLRKMFSCYQEAVLFEVRRFWYRESREQWRTSSSTSLQRMSYICRTIFWHQARNQCGHQRRHSSSLQPLCVALIFKSNTLRKLHSHP